MCGIYEIVSLTTTLEDVSLIFQRHDGYIGFKYTLQIVDAVYTHDGCYLGILRETNNHII